jgi:glycosyltransferase involved in cell wall biosynthesis
MDPKIAIVAYTFPPFSSGGITSAHYNLYEMLKQKGFRVKFFTFADHNHEVSYNVKYAEENEVIRHGTPQYLKKFLGWFSKFYQSYMIREKFEWSYQFCNTIDTAFGSLKINASLKKFKPDILIIPDCGSPGYFIKKLKNCKIILISHHNPARFLDNPLFGLHSAKDASLALRFEKKALQKVDGVICPSSYMLEVFKKTYNFNGPLAVIPNLISQKLIESIPIVDIRQEMGLPEDAIVIYMPSGGSPFKGARYVFEIIRRMASVQKQKIGFYISGSVWDRGFKFELSYLPENVQVYSPGYISYHDNIARIKSCSFSISPTLIESFGMAILEANYCGIPVVTFNTGGNTDIIRNGINGYIIPYLDVESLINHSIKLLTDNSLRNDLHRKTLMFVRDQFCSEKIAREYLNFLFNLSLREDNVLIKEPPITISVILPTYNRSKTIRYCLDSILEQTVSPLEVIVVDDCSTDDTVDIVRSYQDPRIRCIVLDKNSGAQVARNRGIKEAKGEWIAFQDSDDEWVPEKLERQVAALSKVNFDPFTVIHTNCYLFYPETGKKDIWNLPEMEGNNLYPLLLSRPGPMFQGMLVSRLALEKIGYLDEKAPSYQEWATSIRLAQICTFIHLKEPLFIYYLHQGETISKNKLKEITGYQYIIDKFHNDILKFCGDRMWEEHNYNQLFKCLDFKLWCESDKYFNQVPNLKRTKMFIFKTGRFLKIRPKLILIPLKQLKTLYCGLRSVLGRASSLTKKISS